MSNVLTAEQRAEIELAINRKAVRTDEVKALIEHAREMDAVTGKHEHLIDLAGERIAMLSAALTKIRDLAKAGRLDEIFTLANRALAIPNPKAE